jgi:hypothetical protein
MASKCLLWSNNHKGASGNSIVVMIARHFCTEGGSLCGINDRLSTKITKRAREKWISGGAHNVIYRYWIHANEPRNIRNRGDGDHPDEKPRASTVLGFIAAVRRVFVSEGASLF